MFVDDVVLVGFFENKGGKHREWLHGTKGYKSGISHITNGVFSEEMLLMFQENLLQYLYVMLVVTTSRKS